MEASIEVGQDLYQTPCINKINQYLSVGCKNQQQHQFWSFNSVVKHFNTYVFLHQPHQPRQQEGPASSLKRQKSEYILFVTCLLYDFLGLLSKYSSITSPLITFAGTVHGKTSISRCSKVSNSSHYTQDKSTKSKFSALTTAVSTLRIMILMMKKQILQM